MSIRQLPDSVPRIAENFVSVRPHQSYAINAHLVTAVDKFAEELSKSIPNGSPEFEQECMNFTRHLAQHLASLQINDPGIINYIKTNTNHTTASGIKISVENECSFG